MAFGTTQLCVIVLTHLTKWTARFRFSEGALKLKPSSQKLHTRNRWVCLSGCEGAACDAADVRIATISGALSAHSRVIPFLGRAVMMSFLQIRRSTKGLKPANTKVLILHTQPISCSKNIFSTLSHQIGIIIMVTNSRTHELDCYIYYRYAFVNVVQFHCVYLVINSIHH